MDRELIPIEVDLLKNSFTQKFEEIFVPEFNLEADIINEMRKFVKEDYQICNQWLNEIHENLDELKKYNILYDEYVPSNFSQCTQPIFNKLHRFFTHRTDFNNQIKSKSLEHARIAECLDIINDRVHNIEIYLDTPVKQMYKKTNINYEELIIAKPGCDKTSKFLSIDDECRYYHTTEHYDVILSSQILGKSVYRSYIDQDDPTDWDTSGHHCTAGGLHILFNKGSRQHVYQSKHFNRWRKYHKVKSPMCDFPIGTVINKKDLDYVVNKLKKTYLQTCSVIYQR